MKRNTALLITVMGLAIMAGLIVGACSSSQGESAQAVPEFAERAVSLATPDPNSAQREYICVACRGLSKYYFGAGIQFLSDESLTQTLYLDGATGNIDSEGDGDFADDVVVGDDLTITDDATLGDDMTISAGGSINPENATGSGVVFAITWDVTYGVTTTATYTAPANADIIDWTLVVTEAFTDSGTDVLVCGSAADSDMLVDDYDLENAGRNEALDAADMQSDEAQNWGDVGTSDLGLLCIYTGQNGDADAGGYYFTLWYRLD